MKNEDFYSLLDIEFQRIIDNDFTEAQHSRLKQESQKKSYAFLIWFIKFYSNIETVSDYITDGHDDNSCDVILDIVDNQGIKVFYLIQSKWNSLQNCTKEFETTELKSFLHDAQTVLKGDAPIGRNSLFNSRYQDLISHVKANGKVKVIYLSLKNNCSTSTGNITSFEKTLGDTIKVEGFDINRLKRDFISKNYKKSIPPNPLENIYNPELERIEIEIINNENPHIKINTPFEAHVFTVKPSLIYSLVNKYGVSLFDKNIRNPLIESSINNEIKSSLINNPSYFWYYNNGITAITRSIPSISNIAESFQIIGLQIINGAQTAYSIFKAYEEASETEREIIDTEAKVTFRLLKSGGRDFDIKVTKFTNSQNPVSERDFWSNDPIQSKIQNYFFETNIWYEKRDGEFRSIPSSILKVENNFVANAYLAFWLDNPVAVLQNAFSVENDGIDLIFTSHKDNTDGLYEKIFNQDTNPEHMLVSFCMLDILTENRLFPVDRVFISNGFHILTITKTILEKYLAAVGYKGKSTEYIKTSYFSKDKTIIRKCVQYATRHMFDISNDKEEEDDDFKYKLLTNKSHFDLYLEEVQKINLSVEDIESLEIKVITVDDDESDYIEEKTSSLH